MNRAAKRRTSSLAARSAISPSRELSSRATLVVAGAIALIAGKASAEGHVELALLSVTTLAGLAIFRYLHLPAWCSLLLVTAVAARGLQTMLGLPQVVDFLHYPVVLLFGLAAVDRPWRAASRGPGRWLAGFVLLVLLSALAHPSNPLRALLFLLIAGEPLLVIWAISRWGTDREASRTVGLVALLLAAIQVPIAVYQGTTLGWTDPVQGTLTGHGAGHHVLGALFALGLLAVVAAILARRLNPVAGGLMATLCLGMMLATGSMAVLVVASIAAIMEPLLGPSRSSGVGPSRRLTAILVALLLGATTLAFVAAWVPGFFQRALDLATSSSASPEIAIMRDRVSSDPLTLVLGSGPGTTASRASLLLIGPPQGSPLTFLGLEPTELGMALFVASSNPAYGGSVESAASSALGIIGDLGLVGLVAWGTLFFAIWRRAGRSNSWLAPAARSGLLMVAALSFVDNWLEYPEFAVPFAILIGWVLSDVPEDASQVLPSSRGRFPRGP